MDGILNINKPTGMTSHDVVGKIRKLLKQKSVGHAGTLDPAASGVLPICVGHGTRVAEYLSESGKAYRAEIILGIVTDTYDSEGAIVRTTSIDHLTLSQIEQSLQLFLGPQMQLPPRYSAIKIHGQPAYKLARAGAEVSLDPRPIVIFRLETIAWEPPKLLVDVECSKGTYIRSLAYDLGAALGCGAYLGGLVRTRSGPFPLTKSITLEQLAEAITNGTVEHYLHASDTALEHYPALQLDAVTTAKVLHGNPFKHTRRGDPRGKEVWGTSRPGGDRPEEGRPGLGAGDENGNASLARVYDTNGHFLAIAAWDAEHEVWQPKKVFLP